MIEIAIKSTECPVLHNQKSGSLGVDPFTGKFAINGVDD